MGRLESLLSAVGDALRALDGGPRAASVVAMDDADWTASSREAVAKALALLRRLGWIEPHRRRIVVLDAEALR